MKLNDIVSVADVSYANEFSASYVTIGVTDTVDVILSDMLGTMDTFMGLILLPSTDSLGVSAVMILTPK